MRMIIPPEGRQIKGKTAPGLLHVGCIQSDKHALLAGLDTPHT